MSKEVELTGEFECKNCGRIQSIEYLRTCPNCDSKVTLKKFVNCKIGCSPIALDENIESYINDPRYENLTKD